MARWLSHLLTSPKGLRSGRVFMILAVVLFGGIVFWMFRGHGGGPQEAVARDTPVATPADNLGASAPLSGTEASPAQAPSSDPGQTLSSSLGQIPSGETASPSTNAGDASTSQVGAAIAEAINLRRSEPGEIIQVRNKLNKLLQGPATPEQKQTIKDEMAKLSKDWLFGPAAFPGDMLCDTYGVKSGDVLEIIGRRLKVPHEILMQINGIQRARGLQAGHPIKVIHGPFNVKICRSTFTMDLYLQDMYVRSFRVGLGAPGTETPTGLWRVKEGGKLIQPPWYDKKSNRTYRASDPDYPLGTRWIALEGIDGNAKGRTGFAIHGTKDPDQIGTAASQGCIRMHNNEVELMYGLLIPLYSQVEVTE